MAGSLEKIEKLFELKERKIITSDEFSKCKEALLSVNETTSFKESFNQMKKNYISYWKNAFCWNSRATVEEFWEPIIINHVIFSLLRIFSITFFSLFFFAVFFPFLGVLVRRVHDLGKNASYALVPFFSFILFMIGIVISVMFMTVSNFKIGIEMGMFAILVICGIGAIWGVCVSMNRIWFVTARMGENKPNQYGAPRV